MRDLSAGVIVGLLVAALCGLWLLAWIVNKFK